MINFITNSSHPFLNLSPVQLSEARELYSQQSYLLIKSFFSQVFCKALSARMDSLDFEAQPYPLEGPGPKTVREYVHLGKDLDRLRFLMQDEGLLNQIRAITNVDVLTTFAGRLSKLIANSGHQFSWHSDLELGKKVAVSINLSSRPFTGGHLSIKNILTNEIIEIHNNGIGDAVIFPIHQDYMHKVSEVTGDVDRLVLTGWYS